MNGIETKLKTLTQRELVVFDFDETIVDCNSDSWIHKLAENGRLPKHLNYVPGEDWMKHVQTVLQHLHDLGVTEQDFADCLHTMPIVDGMIEPLIASLGQEPDKYDIVILSDANSFFIGSFLKTRKLEKYITTILTNPAKFTDVGHENPLLVIEGYHAQDHCKLSSRNLCKGEALKNYIGKQMLDNKTVYTCINYVGDGQNDFCPSLKLSVLDRVFPRKGYTLDKMCSKMIARQQQGKDGTHKYDHLPDLKASVIPWSSGKQILDAIKKVSSRKETAV